MRNTRRPHRQKRTAIERRYYFIERHILPCKIGERVITVGSYVAYGAVAGSEQPSFQLEAVTADISPSADTPCNFDKQTNCGDLDIDLLIGLPHRFKIGRDFTIFLGCGPFIRQIRPIGNGTIRRCRSGPGSRVLHSESRVLPTPERRHRFDYTCNLFHARSRTRGAVDVMAEHWCRGGAHSPRALRSASLVGEGIFLTCFRHASICASCERHVKRSNNGPCGRPSVDPLRSVGIVSGYE